MNTFFITLVAVAVLLLMALVGYLLAKGRVLSENATADISKILIFVSQPALAIYTFMSTEYSPDKLIDIGIFALLVLLIHVIIMGGSYLVLRKKCKNPIYRIMTIATTMSNCAFFGIPILEAIYPGQSDDLIIYTIVYAVVMNVIGWTIGSAIISQNLKYISVKKMLTNPALIGATVALILFVTQAPITEAETLFSIITATAKMSTPLSMMAMGIRLAGMKFKDIFTDYRIYITIAVKQFAMPLVAFFIVWLFGVDVWLARSFFIISACPAASVVLNYSEIVGTGQKEAASIVLLSTMLSIVTLPIMSLLLQLI